MPLGTLDRTPPPFFRQGPSALTKLFFFSALALFLMVADTRFKLAEPVRATMATALRADLESAEDSSLRASPLPGDPLSWGGPTPEDSAALSQTEVSRAAMATASASNLGSAAGSAERTAPDLSPEGSWQAWRTPHGVPSGSVWSGLALRAMLALVATTVVVRAAWSLVA